MSDPAASSPALSPALSASTRAAVGDAVARVSAAALQPHARVGTVLIAGPEGYHVSAVARAAVEGLEGWAVFVGAADESEQAVRWSFIEVLNRALRTRGVQIPVPQGGAGATGETSDATETTAVGRAISAALDAVGAPVCLLVDHLEWVDRWSAAAVRYSMRRGDDHRRLLVAAAEDLENENARVLLQLAAADVVLNAVVRLPPLDVGDVQELALELLGRPISRRVAARFARDSEGNPTWVAGLIESYRDALELSPHPASIELDRTARVPLLPRQQRAFDTAPPATRAAVEVVAVLREATAVSIVTRLASWLGLTTVYGAFDLDDAIARRLVRHVDDYGVPTIAPPSRVAADRIAAQIPIERRREMHAAAADLLRGSAALSHRIYAAREDDLTLVADVIHAARGRVTADDPNGAMNLALTAHRLAACGDDFERTLLFAGLLALRLHEHPRMLPLVTEFAALPATPVRDAVLADLYTLLHRGDLALAHAQAIMDAPGDDADLRVLRAHSASTLPLSAAIWNEYERIPALVARAREAVAAEPRPPDPSISPDLRWMARPDEHELWLSTWELVEAAWRRDSRAIGEAMARLDRLLRAAPDSAAVIDAVVYQSRTLAYAGRPAEARNRLRRAIRIGASHPDSWMKYIAHTMHSHLLFLTGEWEKSLISGQIAIEHALDDAYAPVIPLALGAGGMVHAARGEIDAVRRIERMLRSVSRVSQGAILPYDSDLADVMRAELAAALGDPAAQLAATEAARSAARPGSVLSWTWLAVDALGELGRAEEAARRAAEALRADSPWVRSPFTAGQLMGRLARARGDAARAVELYAPLMEDRIAQTQPFDLARTRLDYARALLETGERDAARQQARAAAEVFRRLEAASYLERAERFADGIDARPHPRPAQPQLDLLTAREREVALAVASGMTNREVAERLFVSVTTVNFHVRNILAKLGLRSRRELRTLLGGSDGPVRS
ncbi:helix-turn-helix domain-containing protein [Gryllotalpicola ginsengisoli]|uniref:helix-turn-helix domain-containing protein n=1 Tax=Gryllotalpicola ginsengisoli TaxID=444608 RepID=UPI0003B50F18|nr:helix-turn-helix transcriptional regulator [Gryllotalpicola ginsengisoli]